MYKQTKQDKEVIKKIESNEAVSIKGALHKYCGELIGNGLNRDVYALKFNPDYVVKIQRTQSFDNIIEWQVWLAVSYSDLNEWFAPCIIINETGTVLVQKRVRAKMKKFYPKKLPVFFTDFKYANYGFIGDQFVCCDYAGVLDRLFYLDKGNLRNVRWWNHSEKYLYQRRQGRKNHLP